MIFTILLVDDENAITDWLQHLLQRTFGEQVDVYKTDNAAAAKQLLESRRFDIAVLDINMPGANGISILDYMAVRCPATKVIFLTGFRQFEYARKAVQEQVVSYVLKNEEDDKLLDAVRKAMDNVREEVSRRGLLESARRKLDASAPILRRELTVRLVQGLISPETARQGESLPVRLNIDLRQPMCVLIGFHGGAGQGGATAEALDRLYAAGMVIEQCLNLHYTFESAMADEASWIWLLQPKDGSAWNELSYALLRQALELAQTDFNRNTAGDLAFIHGSKPVAVADLPGYYAKLLPLLGYAARSGHAVLTDADLPDGETPLTSDAAAGADYEPVFRNAAYMQKLLERSEKQEFMKIMEHVLLKLEQTPHRHHPFAVEAFMTVSAVFVSYLNRTGMNDKLARSHSLPRLYEMRLHASMADAAGFFRGVAETLFDLQSRKRETRSEHVVDKAKAYILDHLQDDLSLMLLADKVYLNPSYFSILFKNKTGMNVSEFIRGERLAKALALLGGKKYRINEIGRMIGYNNAAYFTRFFKTEMGISPQEYRDNVAEHHMGLGQAEGG